MIATALVMYKYFFNRSDKTMNSRRGNAKASLVHFPLHNFERREDKNQEFGPPVNPELDRQITWSEYDRDELHRNNGYTNPEYSASSSEEVSGSDSDHSRDASYMPVVFENIADFDAGPFQRGIDVPFYWHVPRSGGGTVNDVLGRCVLMKFEPLHVLRIVTHGSYIVVFSIELILV